MIVALQNPGQLNYPSSVGVMGTSIASLKLVISALLSTEPWLRDPDVIPMSWRSQLEQETLARADHEGKANGKPPLKLGILFNDGFMTPHPPITRGLRMIREALGGAGHKVRILKEAVVIRIWADRLGGGLEPPISSRRGSDSRMFSHQRAVSEW
jgi:amidase